MRIILLFLLSFSALAGPACIFSGGNIKCLKDKIGFKSEKSMESGTVDPASVATSADTGSLFLRDTGVIYIKKDDGLTTNWVPLSEVGSPFPAMAKGSIVTSNGTSNGEYTACANGDIIVWDSTESSGIKCIKPYSCTITQRTVSGSIFPPVGSEGTHADFDFTGLTAGATYEIKVHLYYYAINTLTVSVKDGANYAARIRLNNITSESSSVFNESYIMSGTTLNLTYQQDGGTSGNSAINTGSDIYDTHVEVCGPIY